MNKKTNLKRKEPHHIIGIGASAGGMNEINLFFDHTPMDEVSYIIIQHLSPDYKSMMAELLSRHSKLKVTEAKDNMLVECNQVYLVPSDKYMTISEERLHLTDKGKKGGPHLTINKFFNSLAIARGKSAIGVVLSGTGLDGSEGVEAIKKYGGLVLASDPALTAFSDMPLNAIATGSVDYILSPQLMPQAIEYYVNNGGALLSGSFEDKEEHKIIIAIKGLIKEQLPLDFTDYKPGTISRRVKKRAAAHNFNNLSDYFDFLKKDKEEVILLAKDFLISVTSFFRDQEAFDFIQSDVIPRILEQRGPESEIKLWVAGCATGEEAYSLAIILREQLIGEYKNTVVKIFATDVDNNALIHAGKGIYNKQSTKNISPERLKTFFTKEGNQYKVKPEIRKMLIFAQHDLVQNPPYCNMDFISCRNLLIYMTPSLQKKIFLMLLFGLKKDGYLFLGSSEIPTSIITGLDTVNKKWKIYKSIGKKERVPFDAFSIPVLADLKSTTTFVSREMNLNAQNNNLSDAVNEAFMNELGYLLVCINEKNEVIKTYGDTTKYLLQKNFNRNLSDLLPKPLAIAFYAASRTALQTNKKAMVKDVNTGNKKVQLSVNLMVKPLPVKKGDPKILMVLFSDGGVSNPVLKNGLVFDEKIYHDQYIINLEEELKEVKDELQDTLEKLDASNQNMQSFNEELLSANEELQSTNEEMESINEELHTINVDYQAKNKELLELNDDLNNYFRSNINGQLFVNENLLLMKYSPGTVKHINLLDSDIGRPLTNITTNIRFENIVDDIKKVMVSGGVITKEVQANDGKWYQLMTMPYIQQIGHKMSGAIVTFFDITKLKETQLELDKTNKNLKLVNADLDNFVLAASHDLMGPMANIEMSIDVMNQLKVSDDPELNKFLEIINESVIKFKLLLKEMATIGKIEDEMMFREKIDVSDLINDISLSIKDMIDSGKAILTTDIEVPFIYFSKKNLRSILYNLINNAVKYNKSLHPTITISTRKEDGFVLLSVSDNGIGIPEKDLEKVFSLYGRLKNSNIEGQGIGLFLVKKVVDAAGGKVTVESKEGEGSRFTIYFPENLEKKTLQERKHF